MYKLIPTNNSRELPNPQTVGRSQPIAETNGLFSIKFSKAFPSTDSNIEEYFLRSKINQGIPHASTSMAFEFGNSNRVETAADTRLHWISMEDDVQLSTASLLREAPSNKVGDFKTKEARSSYTSIPSKRDTGDSIVSASLLQLLKSSSIEKKSHVSFAKLKGATWNGSSHSSQCLRSRRLLQQRKQLLFDSEKEVLETHGKKDERHKYTRDVSNTEEMEKIIYEHICLWVKQTGGITNKTHQRNSDFSRTLEEWCDFQQLKRKICMKVGDAILDEIVKEMIYLFLQSIDVLSTGTATRFQEFRK